MKQLQKNARAVFVSAGLAIGVLGFSAGVNAGLDYSGYGELYVQLVDVTNTNCVPDQTGGNCRANGNWSVSSSGSIFESGSSSSGSGVASTDISLFPTIDWVIGDQNVQYAESYGDAGVSSPGAGSASSYALTDFDIFVENTFRGEGALSLDFIFDYSIFLSADLGFYPPAFPNEDGGAYAGIHLFDDFSDLLETSTAVFVGGDTTSDSVTLNGSWTFTLLKGETNSLTGYLDTDGSATAVPVPPTVWLLVCGLLGLIWLRGTASKKTLTNY